MTRSPNGDAALLLPGENLDSRYTGDVAHWLRVYTELVDFVKKALAGAYRTTVSRSRTAAAELSEADTPFLLAMLWQYRARLEFWQGRLQELEGAGPSPRRFTA